MDVNTDTNPVTPNNWKTMTTAQLEHERDILVSRRNKICDMEMNTQSMVSMYNHIDKAILFLNQMIENKGK